MKGFADLGVFAAFLASRVAAVHEAAQAGLKAGAEVVQADAKQRIGTYQDGWAPLSPNTLNGWAGHPGKIELGYAPPDNPLLRDGTMRDSIAVTVEEGKATVGSPSKIAVYQEMGTSRAKAPIPPRPFLGPAGFAKGEEAAKQVGQAVTDALAGKR